MWDYVGKECIKSVFSGTLAFLLLVVFAALGSLSQLTTFLNNVDLISLVVRILLLYAAFMVVYLLATVLVYCIRYVHRRRELRAFMGHLRNVRRMYRDEDK
jgi:formate hydrogenlyase subunit 3/multisubunit Na+/H+ antiporter MnhD subunit